MFISCIYYSYALKSCRPPPHLPLHSSVDTTWAALLVERYLSNAASSVLCAFRCVKDHHHLPNCLSLLKSTCVRQAVLDKWFLLNYAQVRKRRAVVSNRARWLRLWRDLQQMITANLPTQILHFRGFASNMVMILRGGIIMSMGDFPESSSQGILVWIISVGRLGVRLSQDCGKCNRPRETECLQAL